MRGEGRGGGAAGEAGVGFSCGYLLGKWMVVVRAGEGVRWGGSYHLWCVSSLLLSPLETVEGALALLLVMACSGE